MSLLALPDELLLCVLKQFDLRALCASATACKLLLRLCAEPEVWHSVTFVVPGRLQSEALRRGLQHTERLKVASLTRCIGRFCKSAQPAAGALTFAGCSGLSDAGAQLLLAPCVALRALDLTGQAHLTGATLALVLRTNPQLEELTLRSCWQRVSRAGWAEGLPEEHRLRCLDLSRTAIDHLELLRLLLCTRHLGTLKLSFCEQLRESGLRHVELPHSLAALHVVGCNFSGHFVRRLEAEVRSVRSDDSLMRDAIAKRPRSPPVAGGAAAGAAGAASPQTPVRQQGKARRMNTRERALAQMSDVAEAADTGAWLHEMLYRYHAESAPTPS